MKLHISVVNQLANMICGNTPFTEFPYRSSSYLTKFFQDIDLDYRHDGSTRFYWVQAILEKLNNAPSAQEAMPSASLVRVIEHILDPEHFFGTKYDRPKAIQQMNEALKRHELLIALDDKTGLATVTSLASSFVTTATTRSKAKTTVTFTPTVFDIPEHTLQPTMVAVMMPFGAEFLPVYEAIREGCTSLGVPCYRADDLWVESTILQEIFNLIFVSRVVVVDFTGKNPNVMYETGIAHTLGKIVVPITQSLDDIPSDLRSHRALKYLPNAEGLSDLAKTLASRLRTVIDGTK